MAEHPQSLPKADLRPHDARPVHEQGGTAPADAHVAPLLGPDAVREDPMFMLDEYLLALVDALGPPLPPRRRSRRRTSSASLTSSFVCPNSATGTVFGSSPGRSGAAMSRNFSCAVSNTSSAAFSEPAGCTNQCKLPCKLTE